jgi:hypothetical protein
VLRYPARCSHSAQLRHRMLRYIGSLHEHPASRPGPACVLDFAGLLAGLTLMRVRMLHGHLCTDQHACLPSNKRTGVPKGLRRSVG